jgi:hypothetical protein
MPVVGVGAWGIRKSEGKGVARLAKAARCKIQIYKEKEVGYLPLVRLGFTVRCCWVPAASTSARLR